MSASGGAGRESPSPQHAVRILLYLGTHDSASPDNQRASPSTPGPLGTN